MYLSKYAAHDVPMWLTLRKCAIAWALPVTLVGCHSVPKPNRPMPQTQKIYHAPAQLFDFDLSNSVLRGKLELKSSCNLDGTSLDIHDQLGQQVRVDTFNLTGNPAFDNLSQESSLKQVNDQIVALYSQKYHATVTGAAKRFNNSARDVAISRLTYKGHNLDLAVSQAYGQAYVIVLNSQLLQHDAKTAQQQLLLLASALLIPGQTLKGSESAMPVVFDLSNTDKTARQKWLQQYCPK